MARKVIEEEHHKEAAEGRVLDFVDLSIIPSVIPDTIFTMLLLFHTSQAPWVYDCSSLETKRLSPRDAVSVLHHG